MRILFVDDDEIVRLTVSSLLAKTHDTTLLEASSPEEGLAMARAASRPIDLVLLDLEYPSRSGPHPVALFRSMFSTLPIVVLSSTEDPESIGEAIGLGATDFIGKGATSAQLASVIEQAIQVGASGSNRCAAALSRWPLFTQRAPSEAHARQSKLPSKRPRRIVYGSSSQGGSTALNAFGAASRHTGGSDV